MKKINSFLALILIIISNTLSAQTSTETFETETNESKTFTDNGVVFDINSHVGTFDVQANFPNTGWNGTANDNRYIDNSNDSSSPASFSIKTTSNLFKVNRFWMYLSALNLDLNVTGTLTVTGMLSGVTKFSAVKSNGFATSLGATNGYSLIDMTNLNGQNYSNIIIDELKITLGGNFRYAGLDAFTWVKDSNVILNPSNLTVSAGNQTNVSCNGGSNGSATVNVSGGIPPYTYTWSPSGGNNATASGLSAGTYTVTVKDAANNIKTQNFTITQPSAIIATTTVTNESCGNSNGSASVSVSGGTSPYTYSWSPSGGTASSATNLTAGEYTVTITDANGCKLSKSVSIQNTGNNVAAPAIKLNFNSGDKLSSFEVIGQNVKWYATANDAANHTNALSPTTSILHNTIYYATQTSNGCESTAALAIMANNPLLGIVSVNNNTNTMIYPNPVTDILNISSDFKINKIIISDFSGRNVLEKPMNGKLKENIDVRQLSKGTYTIQVYTDKETKSIKFIKD